jgi:hypothetical protein
MIEFFLNILHWIDETAFAEAVRESSWIFPAFESIHVVAIVLVLGSIAWLDLRLVGLTSRGRAVSEVSNEMLPWTWASFVVATVFGLLLFASKPVAYVGMAFFDVKMVLILLAGLNMLYFENVVFKTVANWDRDPIPPANARFAGGLSLAFWLSVVICGRLIGFV